MRIARPGSVVGPQQQYMYLKQMDWCRWAAADEIRRKEIAQAALAAVVPVVVQTQPAAVKTTPVRTPVTPPSDENVERPILLPHIPAAPPVTPSRHVAAGEAATRAAVTPGQPRKTPKGKRTKADIAEDSEDDDEISALPLSYMRPKTSRLPRTTAGTKKKTPQTEHKRSATRAGIENSMLPKNNPINGKARPPLKMQRLADGTSNNKRHLVQDPSSPSPVRRVRPMSPTTSRLPQPNAGKKALAIMADPTGTKAKKAPSGDDWMSTANAATVVAPGSKSLLRPARRRRSSFSAVDIVA
jgi:cell division cycle 14